MSEQNQATELSNETGKGPVITRWDGPVFAKVWENTSAKGGIYFNVSVGKVYTDPNTGETRETNNLHKSDLPRMQFVTGEAYRDISQLQQSIKLEQKTEHDQSWLSPPNGSTKPSHKTQNEAAPKIESIRSQSPEM